MKVYVIALPEKSLMAPGVILVRLAYIITWVLLPDYTYASPIRGCKAITFNPALAPLCS